MQNRLQLILWLGHGQVRFFPPSFSLLPFPRDVDHLLSSRHSASIPFTRDECRDSMTLLQSLIGQLSLKFFWIQMDNYTRTKVEKHHHQVIQTCLVAKVFLQVGTLHRNYLK